ncbi:outer membrane beta-barrel protein [Pedobacter sp. PWIIR3]
MNAKFLLTFILLVNVLATKSQTTNLKDTTIRKPDTLQTKSEVHRLEEVVIKNNKPVVQQDIDRISYNIQADPESKSSTILQMMRKVPLLSIDGDNSIRLRGNTNYRIFINGKPSTIVDRNPQAVLQNMPASSIEKVEVITTIPAKYESESLDGIINIVTKKRVSDGYLASVNAAHRFPVGGPGVGGNFTVKDGKFGISGFLGGGFFDSPQITNSNKQYSSNAILTQGTAVKFNGRNGYLGTDFSYEIDSLNLFTAQFNTNANHNRTKSDLHSLLTDFTDPTQSYRLIGDNTGKGLNFDASLNYQLGFKRDKNQLLTFSYRILQTNNDRFGNFDVADAITYQSPDYQQRNDEKSLEQSFQADYTHPFKKLTLEAGVKGIIRNNKSNFLYDTLSTNQIYTTNDGLSNNFNNKQNIIGFYNSYQYRINAWNFKTGVRLEQANVDASFISNNTQINKSYFSFLPSVSIQRQFKNNNSLTLEYSRKVRRPEIQHLNPFVDRSNPNFQSSGNPNLRPASSNSIALSYGSFKKLALNIRVNYDFNSNMVFPTSLYDPVSNVTRSTLENSGHLNMLASNIYISYPLTPKWNITSNLTTIYGRVEGLVNQTIVSNQRVMYYFSASSTYRFDKGWSTAGSVNLNGADINLQGIENSPFRGCGFSLTKELAKNKCYFTAEASSPFSKYRNNTGTTNALNFHQERNNQRYARSFSASLNYRFGGLKSSLKKNKKGIANDDNGISPY